MTPGLLTTNSRLEIAKNFEPSATSPPGQMLQVFFVTFTIFWVEVSFAWTDAAGVSHNIDNFWGRVIFDIRNCG